MPIMKLGLIACLNRPTQLYHIAKPIVEKKKWTEFDSKDSYLKQINPEAEYLGINPCLSNDGSRLVYVCRDEKFLSHSTCF